jgi:hypothetical protein
MNYTRLTGKKPLDEVRLDGSERLTGYEGEEEGIPKPVKSIGRFTFIRLADILKMRRMFALARIRSECC